MKDINPFQLQFMQALSEIQERCVVTALYGKQAHSSREEEFYALASDVIYRVMELLDGYGPLDVGRLDVLCERTGQHLKEDPFIELHDVLCEFVKE